jgi:tetratricopeptide (TPR) repeat protein
VYLRLGRDQDAIEQFRKALSKEPKLADARFHLGECYRRLGDEKKAIEEYQAALEIDPNYTAARARLEDLSASAEPPE